MSSQEQGGKGRTSRKVRRQTQEDEGSRTQGVLATCAEAGQAKRAKAGDS